MSSEGRLGKLLISRASSLPSMSSSSSVLHVLRSSLHWLENDSPSIFLKLSSAPNLALTSPRVSNLSFYSNDSMAVSTTTLKNAVSSLFVASLIGSPGASQAKCFLVLQSLFSLGTHLHIHLITYYVFSGGLSCSKASVSVSCQ